MISSIGSRLLRKQFCFEIGKNSQLLSTTKKTSLSQVCSLKFSTQALDVDESAELNYAYYNEVSEKSLQEQDFFKTDRLVKLQDLFDARVYMGHKEGTMNTFMKPYIFGSRLGHLIIDLDQTTALLKEALNFMAHVAFRNGIILFINKSASTGHIVEKTAKNCGEYSHCRDWRIGTFTDSVNYYGSVTRLPDLLIFLNTTNNVFETHPAVPEAAKHMIPTIGVVDTNSDPRLITYPVPGNDDSLQSVNYFCNTFEQAIKIGKQKRVECFRKPIVSA